MNKNPANIGIVIYEGEGGQPNIEVRIEGETVWLSQSQLVELFQSSKANISEHIKHIFEEGELTRDSVVRKFRITGSECELRRAWSEQSVVKKHLITAENRKNYHMKTLEKQLKKNFKKFA